MGMDGGQKAYCEGVVIIGNNINPGLGDFIKDCVKKSMEKHGLKYEETVKEKKNKKVK